MTPILSFLLFLCGIQMATAQFDERNAIYSTGEVNLGNYIGFDLDLNYVYLQKYAFKIGYTGNIRKPVSQPEDYTSGFTGILILGIGNPYDQMENYRLAIGRLYELNKAGTIRVNVSFGVGLTSIKEPENWQAIDGSFLTENYTWNYRKYNTLGLIINPKIEFPFTRFYGLTFSPMLQLSKDRTYVGIGIGQMIGLLRSNK